VRCAVFAASCGAAWLESPASLDVYRECMNNSTSPNPSSLHGCFHPKADQVSRPGIPVNIREPCTTPLAFTNMSSYTSMTRDKLLVALVRSTPPRSKAPLCLRNSALVPGSASCWQLPRAGSAAREALKLRWLQARTTAELEKAKKEQAALKAALGLDTTAGSGQVCCGSLTCLHSHALALYEHEPAGARGAIGWVVACLLAGSGQALPACRWRGAKLSASAAC